MSILHPFCLNLNDVRAIVTTPGPWRLPEDAHQKAQDKALQFSETDIPEQFKEYNPIHYIALLNASSFFLAQKDEKNAVFDNIKSKLSKFLSSFRFFTFYITNIKNDEIL